MALAIRSSGATPFHKRALIWSFAQRDLKSRFRGTAIGWAWSLVVPLTMVLMYTVVFSIVFRATPPPLGNGRSGIYAVWLLIGLVTFSFVTGAINTSMPALLSSGPLLQKVYIPAHVPVLGSVVATSVQSGIEFVIIFVILGALANVGVSWLALPLIALLLIAFAASAAVALSVFNVYYRDVGQITGVFLQVLFFLTPVIYPATLIPEDWNGIPVRTLMELNPMAEFVGAIRLSLYDLRWPPAAAWGYMLMWTVVMFAIAVWVYRAKGRDVGEEM